MILPVSTRPRLLKSRLAVPTVVSDVGLGGGLVVPGARLVCVIGALFVAQGVCQVG